MSNLAVVTGGTGGMGLAVARALGRAGFTLLGISLRVRLWRQLRLLQLVPLPQLYFYMGV